MSTKTGNFGLSHPLPATFTRRFQGSFSPYKVEKYVYTLQSVQITIVQPNFFKKPL